jgi:CRP-like cAMP-binding protein
MTAPAIDPDPSETDPSVTKEARERLELLRDLIARQPFFKGLDPRHFPALADSAMEMQFEPGHVIIEEGSLANRFYLILEGKVALETELAGRGMISVQTLGPGEDLGWAWLLPPHYAQFTARALEPTKTIFFYGTRLREECEQDHELGYQLMKRVAAVATQCLRATRQTLMELIGATKFPEP